MYCAHLIVVPLWESVGSPLLFKLDVGDGNHYNTSITSSEHNINYQLDCWTVITTAAANINASPKHRGMIQRRYDPQRET